ncbi:MAG: magnesium/cobalt transporter CorA [Deltaproteobacteria bacterium]|nr:magnesium/cobalt transporter CorA [Deltaproteobacteria bacterium]
MFRKAHPPIGARPGTLAIPAGSPPPRLKVTAYDAAGIREVEVANVDDLAAFRDAPGMCWIDVQGLGDEVVLRRIGSIFDIHPLALEDAVNVPQRAKSEVYPNHQLVIARLPILDDGGGVDTPQVCMLIGPRHLLTFQVRFLGFFDAARERLRAGLGPMRSSGPDYLAYALLDTMIDHYYPLAEQISEELEALEDEIVDDPECDALGRLHRLRRQLAVLRRVAWPQREAVSQLVREKTPFVSEAVQLYLRDTFDHVSQIVEMIDSAREMAVGLSELHLSTIGHRTNEVMKVLTLMSSVFIPLTFIAGIYGMNFENMPELRSPVGYFVVLAVMVATALGMLGFFRRRGWLGSGRRRARAGSEVL